MSPKEEGFRTRCIIAVKAPDEREFEEERAIDCTCLRRLVLLPR